MFEIIRDGGGAWPGAGPGLRCRGPAIHRSPDRSVIRGHGKKPLVLLAMNTFDVKGAIDVSSDHVWSHYDPVAHAIQVVDGHSHAELSQQAHAIRADSCGP
jgi:hypothetical protein